MTAAPDEGPHLHAVPDSDQSAVRDHDLDAERIVLGAMMLSVDAADDAAEIVTAASFYRAAHGTLFGAILALRSKGEPTDPVTVAHAMMPSGDLARIGGPVYLAELIEAVPTAAMVGWFARIVAEHAEWRHLTRAGVRVVQMARERTIALADARNRAQLYIHEATTSNVKSDGSRLRDLIGPALDAAEAAAKHEGPIGLATGLHDLDEMLNGLRSGQLVLVGGRPGMGKSIFAVDMARHAAMRLNVPTVIFSLEMSKAELTNRIISSETGVPLRTIETGKLSDREWSTLARRTGEIGDAPLIIDDSPSLDLAEIRAKARRLHQRSGLGLVVVDYLQLLSATTRSENRSLEVGEFSRGLKLLARELECPVIAASQLNRNAEARADRRPAIADLRESGSLEQDSDIVILLHRDAYYDPKKRPGEVDLIVAKNRNGPMGAITACAQLHLTRIVDFAADARP
jgi:replicative DNA helicase